MKEILEKLNQSIRDAEWNRNSAFMAQLLAEDLSFRRADGTIVNKDNYLAALEDKLNTYDTLENASMEILLNEEKNYAVVIILVNASGKRRKGIEQKSFDGKFRNIRFFRKTDHWELFV